MRRTWIAAIIVVLLGAGIAAYSVGDMGSTASNSGTSTPSGNSSSLGSTVPGSSTTTTRLPTSQTSTSASTSSTVSRVADTESTFAANVTLSNSVTTSPGVNTTASVCPVMGARWSAQMELQVVSDNTGLPVQQGQPSVSVVFQIPCDVPNQDNGQVAHVTELLYFDSVSEGSSGWFDLPSLLGDFNFTVGYAGHTYSFRAFTLQETTTCVALSVPSGVVTVTKYEFSDYHCDGSPGAWAGQDRTCYFSEVYLRVLSDSDPAPVAGAVVTTAYDFAIPCYTSPTPCSNPSNCGEAFKNFTTTSTEWYAFGDSADSFSVEYGGQTYNVTASQATGSTCVTLHVPSGTVNMTYGASCAAALGSGVSFAEPSTSTSMTVSSSTTSSSSAGCVQGTNTTKGSVFIKVVADRGEIVTNGTLTVTGSGDMADGEEGATAQFCIWFAVDNGTSYLPLVWNSTFITSGYYNVTLWAGYQNATNNGPYYLATIPPIQVYPNSTVWVTVSVPSGVVTIVTSNDVSNAVTTTTTSATTTKNGG
jgi:hypothetical protein